MLDKSDTLDGKYEVIRIIGCGGMSTVYLCKHLKFETFWAVKEVRNKAQDDKLLLGEPDILKKLKHPGIPGIVDVFYQNHNIYIVEDYISGETLEALVRKKGKMESEEIFEITQKICEVVEYLHGLNPPVIHRDLKPSNIMITPGREVTLIDFGISRVYKEGSEGGTTVSMGTKGYAAPEQYGASQSGKQADVYGIGATMYYMAIGRDPSFIVLPWDDEVYASIDPDIKRIIQKAVQLEAVNRYKDAFELREDIKGLQSIDSTKVQRSIKWRGAVLRLLPSFIHQSLNWSRTHLLKDNR